VPLISEFSSVTYKPYWKHEEREGDLEGGQQHMRPHDEVGEPREVARPLARVYPEGAHQPGGRASHHFPCSLFSSASSRVRVCVCIQKDQLADPPLSFMKPRATYIGTAEFTLGQLTHSTIHVVDSYRVSTRHGAQPGAGGDGDGLAAVVEPRQQREHNRLAALGVRPARRRSPGQNK
jgi:hypothetical protein